MVGRTLRYWRGIATPPPPPLPPQELAPHIRVERVQNTARTTLAFLACRDLDDGTAWPSFLPGGAAAGGGGEHFHAASWIEEELTVSMSCMILFLHPKIFLKSMLEWARKRGRAGCHIIW